MDTIRGWILFDVRILFEEIRYVIVYVDKYVTKAFLITFGWSLFPSRVAVVQVEEKKIHHQ